MFFNYPEPDHESSTYSSNVDENDLLKELLLDCDLPSPQNLNASSKSSFTQAPTFSSSSISRRIQRPMDISIPSLYLDNHGASAGSRQMAFRPSGSPTFAHSLPSPPPLPLISPPRIFVQDLKASPSKLLQEHESSSFSFNDLSYSRPFTKTLGPFTSTLAPPPLPTLSLPSFKKRRNTENYRSNCITGSGRYNIVDKKQTRCAYPDCSNLRRSGGFCNRHSGKVCIVDGCNKSALSRGKCPEHGGGSRCKREGCSKFAQTKGLCKSHGGGRLCTVTGCTKNAHQNRLCRSHGGGKRCDYRGCPKWAQRSGYCCAHTKLSAKTNGTSAPLPVVSPVNESSSSMAPPPLQPPLISPQRLFSYGA